MSLISIAGFSPVGHEYNNPQESTATTMQIADTATSARGPHLFKVGAEWYNVRQSAFRDVQARGFLTFVQQGYTGNALADLLIGLPVLTGGAQLDNPQNLRANTFSLFAHDDWRVARPLTVSLGVRYDYSTPPHDEDDRANLYDPATGALVQVGTGNIPRGGYATDGNNVAPRVGFAWSLDELQRWVVRGGYGVYYNQGSLATSEGLYFNPPYFNLSVYFPAPGLPPLTLNDPFPANFPVFIPQSATAYQSDLQTPWLEHWNVNVQYVLNRGRALEVAYVGSRGHDLISARDLNQPAASPAVPNLRPNPQFADITLIESRGTSKYNALQVKFRQQMDGGLSGLVSYTYGKSTDDASGFFTSAGDPNFPQNSLDPGAERGRSSFDVRQRLAASLSYDLPFKGNVLARRLAAAGGRHVGERTPVHGGDAPRHRRQQHRPIEPRVRLQRSAERQRRSGPDVGRSPETQWFDTCAFSFPAFGTFGNSGRNTLEGPAYRNVNLAVIKRIPAGAARLQVRLEVFNLFNRTNLDLPDAFLGSPTFGQILSRRSAPPGCSWGSGRLSLKFECVNSALNVRRLRVSGRTSEGSAHELAELAVTFGEFDILTSSAPRSRKMLLPRECRSGRWRSPATTTPARPTELVRTISCCGPALSMNVSPSSLVSAT